METALTTSTPRARVEELYVRHVPGAVRLARLLTGDDLLAEDIAQDAFIRSVGRFDHLRDRGSFDRYLRTAVVNGCRMRYRRLRLERAWNASQPVLDTPSLPPDVETRSHLWELLVELPWRQRAALVLRYYEDLPVEQVGDLLHCSRRAANSLVSRGLASLRVVLTKEDR